MIDRKRKFQEIFEELRKFSLQDKIQFLELFHFSFTISSRAIWSDETSSDKDKIEAFKWLNELIHRIWNLYFDLKREAEGDSITRLYENMKFYGEQSALLRAHLVPTLLHAFETFKNIEKNRG